MTHDTQETGFRQEWAALQATFEQYERGGLTIKLVAVVLVAAGLLTSLAPVLMCVLVAVLWLQEGIWRTFQGRIGLRLLKIEAGLRGVAACENASETVTGPTTALSFQLHSEWQANRPGGLGLIGAYLANSLRPTVAYPYVVLLAGIVVWVLLQGSE